MATLLLPLAWGGFALSAVTGTALFATGATGYAVHPLFQAKLAVIGAAGANAALLQRAGGVRARPGQARAAALASLAFWTAAVGLGRWIAYG